jgi:hypothetical protein
VDTSIKLRRNFKDVPKSILIAHIYFVENKTFLPRFFIKFAYLSNTVEGFRRGIGQVVHNDNRVVKGGLEQACNCV